MLIQQYPVTQDLSKGIVVAIMTPAEWEAVRVAVNRVAVSDEPSDDGAHEFWRQCRLMAAGMHG